MRNSAEIFADFEYLKNAENFEKSIRSELDKQLRIAHAPTIKNTLALMIRAQKTIAILSKIFFISRNFLKILVNF